MRSAVNANEGLVATVKLVMTDGNNEQHIINTYTYTWGAPEMPTVTLTEVDPATGTEYVLDSYTCAY